MDVRHFEARITCRPERSDVLELVASTRVDFGVSNIADPQGVLRAGLRPVWRVVQGGGADPVEIDASLDGTWHQNGITAAVTIGPVALGTLKRGKQLMLSSGLPTATAFLFMPLRSTRRCLACSAATEELPTVKASHCRGCFVEGCSPRPSNSIQPTAELAVRRDNGGREPEPEDSAEC